MKLVFISVILIIFNLTVCIAQKKKVDSLITIANSKRQDTSKIKALNTLTMYYENNDTSKAWAYNRQAQALGNVLQWIPGLAKTYLISGWLYQDISEFDLSIEYMNKSLRLYQKQFLKNPGDLSVLANISGCYNNLGNVYTNMGNYSKALQNYILGLRKIENILQNNHGNEDYLRKVTACFTNLGSVYSYMNDDRNALEYFIKAKDMAVTLNDSNIIARCFINIGIIYKRDSMYDKSIECYQKAKKIFENQNDNDGAGLCLHNLGIIFMLIKKYNQALVLEKQALVLNIKLGNKHNECKTLGTIGEILFKQNKFPEAEIYLKNALGITEIIQSRAEREIFYSLLSQLYAKKKDYNLAYKYHLLFTDLKDSIFNKENTKQFADMKEKYESDKKQQQIVVQKTQLEKKEVEVKQQKTMRNAFVLGFSMMLILAIVIFKSFRQKKKANIIIEQKNQNLEQANAEIAAQRDEIESQRNLVILQKNEIEEIHQELKDSIYYAKRIQQAVMPDIDEILIPNIQNPNTKTQEGLELGIWSFELEAFILFKPKDIVSGDFYFIDKRRNILILAVVDCTGHGVPGGFMSMLGIAFLNEIIARDDVQSAGKVLDELRKYIIKSLQQKGESGEQKDGMDIALCAINMDTLEMQFAGANNPCYVIVNTQPVIAMAQPEAISTAQSDCFVRNDEFNFVDPVSELSDSEPIELIELKGDKMPIGIYTNMQPFTNQIYQLQKGVTIYLMSDGYEDQFGGPYRKKFLAKNLKNLLIANCQLPMANQKHTLETTITEWIGAGEQIDDITIIGIKI